MVCVWAGAVLEVRLPDGSAATCRRVIVEHAASKQFGSLPKRQGVLSLSGLRHLFFPDALDFPEASIIWNPAILAVGRPEQLGIQIVCLTVPGPLKRSCKSIR